MNLFAEDFIQGYTKYEKIFDKWCEKASFLGDIQQCAICELDSSGHAFIASNRPDIGEQGLTKKWYLYEPEWSFFKNPREGFNTYTTQFGNENSEIYAKEHRYSWFYYTEVLDDKTQRNYGFVSNSPNIYDKLIQNINVVKKFIKFFKEENKDIIEYCQEHKFNLAAESTNFFRSSYEIDKTQREKINDLLQSMGILDSNQNITEREWQCIDMLKFGKSANQTGKILGISRRTVETHFDHIKKKLKLDSKSSILETIS